MAGRPAKPLADHLKDGTYRPDRHGPLPGAAVPVADEAVEVIARPAALTGRAAEFWDELVAQLGGLIRRRDVTVLVELCRWTERSERIAASLDSLAPTDKPFKGLLIAAGIATDKIAVLTGRFGLSPADRARIRGALAALAGPPKPKVPTRPKTALDLAGKPTEEPAATKKPAKKRAKSKPKK